MTVVAHQVIDYLQTQKEMLVAEVGNEGKNKASRERTRFRRKRLLMEVSQLLSVYTFFPSIKPCGLDAKIKSFYLCPPSTHSTQVQQTLKSKFAINKKYMSLQQNDEHGCAIFDVFILLHSLHHHHHQISCFVFCPHSKTMRTGSCLCDINLLQMCCGTSLCDGYQDASVVSP